VSRQWLATEDERLGVFGREVAGSDRVGHGIDPEPTTRAWALQGLHIRLLAGTARAGLRRLR
jgi:hypothetical protein